MEQILSTSMLENKLALRELFGQSVDFYTKDVQLAGFDCCICMFEGLSSIERLWIMMLDVASHIQTPINSPQQLYEYLLCQTAIPMETKTVSCISDAQVYLTAGTTVFFIDGVDRALVISTQSMQFRSVGEPSGEGNLRGSREGFIEILRMNISLLRRLIRTDSLRIETMTAGQRTQTELALCYDQKLCPPQLLRYTKAQLEQVDLPVLLDSGYLIPFLGRRGFRFFSGIGYTERPDRAAAKICEGKIVVLVNGSPFALVFPWLFYENFQSMDDYSSKAYFASFIRLLKYAAFFIAILFPGIFVCAAGYTPEIFPPELLYKIAAAEKSTPLPLFLEMMLANFLLEIIREAGLRLPKPIGHSVSLVAALIVGDAATKAGLLGIPVVIVAALTTICTFVVPSVYEPVTVLRMLFILAGGLLGPAGMIVLFFWMLLDICGLNSFGIPYTTPISPFQSNAWRDVLLRMGWRTLSKKPFSIEKFEQERGDDNAT